MSDVVTLMATVNAAWRSSMEVGVRVEAEDLRGGHARHTLTAYFTLVALDEDGNPTSVPPLVPATPEDERRWREANARRTIRLETCACSGTEPPRLTTTLGAIVGHIFADASRA